VKAVVVGSIMMVGLWATVASAQDAISDWDLTENDERRLTAASMTFSSGVSLILRCANGQYDALISGIPPVEAGTEWRTISLQFGDGPASERQWFVGTNPAVAISRLPARLARQLREGGVVKVRVEDPVAGRRMRYDLDLPESAANIDRTLTACDRPTEDVRDSLVEDLGENGLPMGIEWNRPPEPRYPDGPTFERGFVTISCLNRPDGRLQNCIIESEYPAGGGFGRAALNGIERGSIRVVGAPDAPVPRRMILFNTNFRLESESESANRPLGTSSRLRRER
jgi:hypothetical protein